MVKASFKGDNGVETLSCRTSRKSRGEKGCVRVCACLRV